MTRLDPLITLSSRSNPIALAEGRVAGRRFVLAAIVAAIALAPASTVNAQQAVVSTASISFLRDESVFLISADGTRVSRVLRATPTFTYWALAWSRDGRLLAVAREEATDSHGYTDVVVFRNRRVWATLPGGMSSQSGSPSWAPDGRRLVLVGYQSQAGGGLYIQRPRSRSDFELTPELLDPDGPADDMPAWSPDGSWIAFARTSSGGTSLFLIQPNRAGLTRLTSTTAMNPSWSPDSKRLVFDNGRRIAVIDLKVRKVRYLTRPKGRDTDPAWSPDGRTIAFVRYPSTRSGRGDIWLMNTDGRRPRLLIRNAEQPTWKRR